ncbi:MAG: hypothetical protein KZQ75_09810 [Candidatus Thiodiazotropha sp. (ex Myrtea spinifera)]|nr:hypothetical protein [Candidatus Thiodiazotropha sp. (ex Myrtea spinifera)]
MNYRRAIAGWLLSVAIIAAVAHTLFPGFPKTAIGLLTWSAGLLLMPDISLQTQRQVFILFMVGLIGIAWGLIQQVSVDWQMILSGNALLLGMLAAVSFLRLITRPDTEAGEVLPSGRRAVWSTLIGVHLFGAVINLSSVFIMGDRISRLGRLSQTQTVILTRGFSAAAFWSPFFAAMAAALTYAPGASLPQIWLMGMPLAAFALLMTALGCQRSDNFTGYPMHISALTLPALLALGVLLLHQWKSDWHILGIICLLAPTLSLLVLFIRFKHPLTRIQNHITVDLPGMQNELSLFLAAGVMAAGLNAVFAAFGGWLPFSSFGGIEASLVLFFMVFTSILGVHPVINIAALGTLLAPLNPNGTLLAMTFLSAWSIGVASSPYSGINLSMQGRYQQQGLDSLKWNGIYSAVMLLLSMTALNLFDLFGLD